MEAAALAERIIHDINVVFRRESHLDEFDIIPVLESQNKSPVIHINTKIALESWCVKLLYLHVYTSLMDWRERKLKADNNSIFSWSEILLLLNPDVTTAWNIRKELILSGKLSFNDELRLCLLILTRRPKSSDVYIHRRWLLSHILSQQQRFDISYIEHLVSDELKLCTIGATRYANNYCAWSHRQWVHNTLTVNHLSKRVLFDELEWSETYIKQHVSDHSGLHFRQFLLKTIIGQPCASPLPSQFTHLEATVPDSTIEGISQEMQNEENDLHDRTIDNLLSIELSLIRNLIRDFLGHEALWYHSRFILHMLHSRQTANPNNPECSSVALTGPILKKTRTDCTIEDEPMVFNWKGCRSKVMEEELSFTNDILAKYPLQHFAACHKRWLLHFFGFEH